MNVPALVTRLQAAGITRLYRINTVPASPTYPYAVLTTTGETPQVRTLDGSGDLGDRVTLQFFSRTEGAVNALADIAFGELDGKPLPEVADSPVGELQVTSGIFRDPDDYGVLARTDTYRYH